MLAGHVALARVYARASLYSSRSFCSCSLYWLPLIGFSFMTRRISCISSSVSLMSLAAQFSSRYFVDLVCSRAAKPRCQGPHTGASEMESEGEHARREWG